MSSQPNILFILSDQHSQGVMGCYGNSAVHTPCLDALAEEGVVFDAAYCGSPLCVPSRLSMLTGRHPHGIGVWGLGDTIASNIPTWPVPLSIAGWHTLLCGRMHLAWPDRNHGFETRLCGDAYPTLRNHFADWTGPEDTTRRGLAVAEAGIGTARQDGDDDLAQGQALRFLHSLDPSRLKRPFALCVGFYRPHTPFCAPADLASLYDDLDPEVDDLDENLPDFYQSLYRHFGFANRPPTREEAVRAIRMYYAMVTGMDRRVGLICEALRAKGLWDNTLIIYSSDHGETLGRHGLWFKSNFYEESIRVPLIVRFPGGGRRGARVKDPVSLLDLFPTFCEIAGVQPYNFLDGESLMPLITGKGIGQDRSVFAEYADYGIHTPMRMIRKGRHKLIFAAGYDPVLFDLVEDPRERANLAGHPEHRATVESLMGELLKGWEPKAIRSKVMENQRNRDLFIAAEDAIREGSGTTGFPWG
jgi:choline-sulfatase